jgi:hypothetical protein
MKKSSIKILRKYYEDFHLIHYERFIDYFIMLKESGIISYKDLKNHKQLFVSDKFHVSFYRKTFLMTPSFWTHILRVIFLRTKYHNFNNVGYTTVFDIEMQKYISVYKTKEKNNLPF